MDTQQEALTAFAQAWPELVEECRAALGSELHYQAVVYHCLRSYGRVPRRQLGMNVKIWIPNCATALFQTYDKRKHPDFGGGFEPIPDVVIFKPDIDGDWRRRNNARTLRQMLAAIEVKASERQNSRLSAGEICRTLVIAAIRHVLCRNVTGS